MTSNGYWITYAKGSRYPQSSIKPILPIPSLGPNPGIRKTKQRQVGTNKTRQLEVWIQGQISTTITTYYAYLQNTSMCHRYGHIVLSQSTRESLLSLWPLRKYLHWSWWNQSQRCWRVAGEGGVRGWIWRWRPSSEGRFGWEDTFGQLPLLTWDGDIHHHKTKMRMMRTKR